MENQNAHSLENKGQAEACPIVEEVPIRIDDKAYLIHRGQHSVSQIKALGGVPAEYALDQVHDCQFVPLPDDGHVSIKDGEIFFSHPKRGGSS